MPEAETTPQQPKHVAAKTSLNPERIQAVLETVSDERLQAEREKRDLERDIDAKNMTLTERLQPLLKAVEEAEADLRAHDRYKHQIPEQEWAMESRGLRDAVDTAKKSLESPKEEARKELFALHQRLMEKRQKIDALSKEWASHLRRAQKASVDTSEYWTPEKGLPPEGEEETP